MTATLTVLIAAAWSFSRAVEPPRSLAAAGSQVLALDASGKTRWTHQFKGQKILLPAGRWSYFGEIDADSRNDVLATVELSGTELDTEGGELLRLSESGRLEWSSTLHDHVDFRAEIGRAHV